MKKMGSRVKKKVAQNFKLNEIVKAIVYDYSILLTKWWR